MEKHDLGVTELCVACTAIFQHYNCYVKSVCQSLLRQSSDKYFYVFCIHVTLGTVLSEIMDVKTL